MPADIGINIVDAILLSSRGVSKGGKLRRGIKDQVYCTTVVRSDIYELRHTNAGGFGYSFGRAGQGHRLLGENGESAMLPFGCIFVFGPPVSYIPLA
jgi:hypothetical protein